MWMCIVLLSAHAQVATFDLTGPWSFRGDASIQGGELALVEDEPNAHGAAWVDSAFQIPTGGGFHARFEVRLDPSISPAGGMVFAVQSDGDNALGEGASGMGYEGIAPSIAVELDLWQSLDGDDPSDNHVGIDLDGSITSVATAQVPFPLDSGDSVFVWVDYIAGELRISLSESDTTPDEALLAYRLDLPEPSSQGQQDLWVGFTASAGGNAVQRVVRDFRFVADGDRDGDSLLDYEDPETGEPSDPEGDPPSETSETGDTALDLPRVFFCSCSSAPRSTLWAFLLVPFVLKRRRSTEPRPS